MALDDEDRPLPAKPALKDLTPLGIAELETYISGLEAEISRARAVITAKRGHKSGAEALFKR